MCGWGHQKQVHQPDQEQVQDPDKPVKIIIHINMVNITCYNFIGFYTKGFTGTELHYFADN